MIKSKREISGFLRNFEIYANWDGEKYYLTIDTVKPKGTLTIMKYGHDIFTFHRKNELYWDIKEIEIEKDMLKDILWGFRKVINECIREKLVYQ